MFAISDPPWRASWRLPSPPSRLSASTMCRESYIGQLVASRLHWDGFGDALLRQTFVECKCMPYVLVNFCKYCHPRASRTCFICTIWHLSRLCECLLSDSIVWHRLYWMTYQSCFCIELAKWAKISRIMELSSWKYRMCSRERVLILLCYYAH